MAVESLSILTYFLPHLIGISLGLISGLIPGVGNFVLMLLIWPLLSKLGIFELLMMYASMAAISQYIGSIPAIVYGIPGESSSYPAVAESKRLTTTTQVSQAISGSAFGSAAGSMLIVILCYTFAEYTDLIKYFYNTKILVGLLLTVTLVMIFTVNNRWYINVLLIASGLLLGLIGYNSYLGINFATFGNMYLYAGLPMPVVLICLFAIPQMMHHINSDVDKKIGKAYDLGKLYILNPLALVGSTLIGFFGGLIPGLTTVFSSTAAYNVSMMFTKDPVKRIVVSETANNAGAFSMLLPLLIFGVPLIGSEAILLFLMEQKGYNLVQYKFSDFLPQLALGLALVNLVGFLIAWPLSRVVPIFYKINLKILLSLLIFALFCVTLYTGYMNYSMQYYFVCFIILAPIGVLLRNVDTLPLVFAFIIHNKLIDGTFRLYQLIN
jgi:putative tricarboxylic transport membrane protein